MRPPEPCGPPGTTALLILLLLLPIPAAAQPVPRHYVAYRTAAPLTLDGHLDEPAWQAAPWTDAFTDIEGDRRPPPRFRTRAKMLWDDAYFYVAATLEEPHLWATLTERDAVIFHDNDFEVFIDPDGDTHLYYEVELNALGTVWDLLLVRPYRDGGPPLDAWDVRGLGLGLHLDGTLNDPSDTDRGWTVELALPWEALREAAPGDRPPQPGETWRVNFSRVQWHTDVVDGRYVKRTDPATGRPLPEDNWVWSPQGVIDMHRPERWGFVLFSDRIAGTGTTPFVPDPNERVKDALRHLHEAQRAHFRTHGRYADDLAALGADTLRVDGLAFTPTLYVTPTLYEITAPGFDGATVHIRHDGRVWVEKP
ncbi:MAG: hypothetical protein KatS3mg043_1946 [Rhodothermaceae bacterium]|nr:MAG: hypothetical protein KatS3mg043_1946 [Rhodothermaceae bacterium]